MSISIQKNPIEQKKLNFKSLPKYLESVQITDKTVKDISHTILGDKELKVFSGKYKVKPENKEYFYNLYTKWVFKNNMNTHLTEKHHDDYSPVLIDLDFRYPFSESHKIEYYDESDDESDDEDKEVLIKYKRIYKLEHIKKLLNIYFEILEEVLEINISQKVCYIMEKSSPVYDTKKNVMKDGVHIIMPNIVSSYAPLFYARKKILESQELIDMFKKIGFTNSIDDIVDEAVIQRNNWFMYGSCKPGKEPYQITSCLRYDEIKEELNSCNEYQKMNPLKLVKLFSVYDIDPYYICNVKENTGVKLEAKKIEKKKQFQEKY